MTRSPTNNGTATKWKEVIYNKHNKGKRNMMNKTAAKKG